VGGANVFSTFNAAGSAVIAHIDNTGNAYFASSISNPSVKLGTINSSEWVTLDIDSSSKVVSGMDFDGNQFFFGNVYAPNVNTMQEEIKKLKETVEVLCKAVGVIV